MLITGLLMMQSHGSCHNQSSVALYFQSLYFGLSHNADGQPSYHAIVIKIISLF